MSDYDTLAATLNKQPTTLVRIFLDTGEQLFSEKRSPLFPGARPYLDTEIFLGQEIKDNLTLNSRVTLTFFDDVDPAGGTFWRKLKASDPKYANRIIEIKKGFVGLIENQYITIFKGVMGNIRIKGDSKVEIISKGLLKLINVQLPKTTDGKLLADIAGSATTLILTFPTGADISQYASTGYVRIDDEIIQYSGISSNTLTGLVRGQFNGDGWDLASAHTADAAVQQVTIFNNVHPVDVITDMLDLVGIPAGDRNAGSFSYIKDNWLAGQKVRAVLDTPTSIKKYLKELKETFFLSMWQGEDQKIHLDFLGPRSPGATFKTINQTENILLNSEFLDDGEGERITQYQVYFNLIGGEKGDEVFDYRNQTVFVDATAEADFKEEKVKSIMSRWLRSNLGAESLVRWMGANYTRIFKQGRTTLSFELETQDDDLQVGDIFKLSTDYIQDANGAALVDGKFQVLSKKQTGLNKWKYRALDVILVKTYGFIGPPGLPDFTSATDEQKEYAYISDSSGQMSDASDGYYIF